MAANTAGTSRSATITAGGQYVHCDAGSRDVHLRAHARIRVADVRRRCVQLRDERACGLLLDGGEQSVVARRDQRRVGRSGGGSIGYSVAANTAVTGRSATITAGGKSFTVTQAAASCSFSISSTGQSATSSGGAVSVSVTATTSCAWTAVSNASWITVTAGASGSGNGTASLNVAANTSARTARAR